VSASPIVEGLDRHPKRSNFARHRTAAAVDLPREADVEDPNEQAQSESSAPNKVWISVEAPPLPQMG